MIVQQKKLSKNKNKDFKMIINVSKGNDKDTKDEKKLLNWQTLAMVMVLLLSIMLMLPEYEGDSSATNNTQDQSQMKEMVSSAGN